jgi:hypothetical protein
MMLKYYQFCDIINLKKGGVLMNFENYNPVMTNIDTCIRPQQSSGDHQGYRAENQGEKRGHSQGAGKHSHASAYQ